jgi:DNA (cytosine-5)-methyltransferase 1
MQFIELFAGIGLFRRGLEALGPQWNCGLANDISEAKARAYRLNFDDTDFLLCDVSQLGIQHVPAGTDLITASFPCQDVSLAGNRAGLNGPRSSAFHQFIRIVAELAAEHRAPQTVLIENVAGLLTSHRGADIRAVLLALNELGYNADVLLLDAAVWLPQSRPRVFIVGRLNTGRLGIDRKLNALHGPPAHPARPQQVQRVVAANADLSWSFLNLPELPQTRPHTLSAFIDTGAESWFEGPELVRELGYIRDGSHARLKAAELAAAHDGQVRWLAGYRRMRDNLVCLELRDDGLAGCLRTPTGGSSRQLLVEVQPGQVRIRYMTPREYARLMGLPDTFALPANTREALYGLGDAVAVPVVTWLGAALEAQAAPVHAPAPALAPVA